MPSCWNRRSAISIMAAAAEQVGAPGHADLLFRGIAIFRDAGIDVVFEAVELLVEDEVDHAGHGVGAINAPKRRR